MIKPIQNIHDYIKYGKKIYESANGNVIRKKTTSPRLLYNGNKEIDTTKTILNKDSKVEKTLFRSAVYGDNSLSTFVTKEKFDLATGKRAANGFSSKEYFINGNEKKIIDNSKPAYDYKITKLPDGRKEYEIAFPEVTIIKDGVVTKTQHNAKGIIE